MSEERIARIETKIENIGEKSLVLIMKLNKFPILSQRLKTSVQSSMKELRVQTINSEVIGADYPD